MRPQRGSRAMSIIGENVHWIPTAKASRAATRAAWRTSSGSQLADCPSGIGKMVVYPWITSSPKISGIPSRLSLASRCASALCAGVPPPNSEPHRPWRISFFVWSARPRNASCDICPSFSSSVILASNASIFRSVSAGVAARRPIDPAASNAISSAAWPCRTGTFQNLIVEEDILLLYLFLLLFIAGSRMISSHSARIPSEGIRGLRWWMIVPIMLGSIVNYCVLRVSGRRHGHREELPIAPSRGTSAGLFHDGLHHRVFEVALHRYHLRLNHDDGHHLFRRVDPRLRSVGSIPAEAAGGNAHSRRDRGLDDAHQQAAAHALGRR